MSDEQITLECALDAVLGTAVYGKSGVKTWCCKAPLRFVMRHIPDPADNTLSIQVRILQQAWSCMETGEVEWRDVPLEE